MIIQIILLILKYINLDESRFFIIIIKVKEEVLKDIINKVKEESEDNFDYWEEHIKYVYE